MNRAATAQWMPSGNAPLRRFPADPWPGWPGDPTQTGVPVRERTAELPLTDEILRRLRIAGL